jgi:hypothetical protein
VHGGGVGEFPKDERFKYGSVERKLNDISPGPTTAAIDLALPRIGASTRRNRTITQSIIQESSRDRFSDSKKIYFRELQKDTQGRDSPGFIYDTHQMNSI